MSTKYFNLFPNCILVKGHARSSICDMQRENLTIIPNDLYDILKECEENSVEQIINDFGKNNAKILEEYFEFLLQNEYGFFSKVSSQKSINISQEYCTPESISNAIIDIDSNCDIPWEKVLSNLHELGCKFIQLRAYRFIDLNFIESIILSFPKYRFKSIELIVKDNKKLTDKDWVTFYNHNPYISQLTIHSANKSEFVQESSRIVKTKQKITSCFDCGQINKEHFTYNFKSYVEGLNHNSCLNKKISIDVNGFVKNCPSFHKNYGHIKEKSLLEIVKNDEFKKLWSITKDQINICKICEFRKVCTDCRAYIEEPENLLSKPLKCGYNPYTTEWEKWSNNQTKISIMNNYKTSII